MPNRIEFFAFPRVIEYMHESSCPGNIEVFIEKHIDLSGLWPNHEIFGVFADVGDGKP